MIKVKTKLHPFTSRYLGLEPLCWFFITRDLADFLLESFLVVFLGYIEMIYHYFVKSHY